MNIYILYNNNEATVTEWWLVDLCGFTLWYQPQMESCHWPIHWLVFSVNFSNISALSVICVVFLWSVSIDQAYLNVLVVISKLLGQSTLGMRQLPRMNILLFKEKIGCVIKINNTGKVNVIFVTIVNKAFSVREEIIQNM